MFKKTTVCPNPKNSTNNICPGVRKDGTLSNACASCSAYKKYVKKAVPDKN